MTAGEGAAISLTLGICLGVGCFGYRDFDWREAVAIAFFWPLFVIQAAIVAGWKITKEIWEIE